MKLLIKKDKTLINIKIMTTDMNSFVRNYHKKPITKNTLCLIVYEGLEYYNGKANIIDIAKYIHKNYENLLKNSGIYIIVGNMITDGLQHN